MELANILLALGGDAGQQINKYAVTPSEVAVMQYIHGNDAVTDINVFGRVNRTGRTERERLLSIYGKSDDGGPVRCPALDALFPGVAARLFETFREMDLDAHFFASPDARPVRKAEPEVIEVIEPLNPDAPREVEAIDPIEPEEAIDDVNHDEADQVDADGIDDLNDGVGGKSEVKSVIDTPAKASKSAKAAKAAEDILG